jgi:uncharacterized protein (DUF952 family)
LGIVENGDIRHKAHVVRFVFKIFRPPEWQDFCKHKMFAGSVHDQRDGFIHLCGAGQLPATLAKHYADEENIILARFCADTMKALTWEISRGGEKFPHLYASLRHADLDTHGALIRDGSCCFILPDHILGTQDDAVT